MTLFFKPHPPLIYCMRNISPKGSRLIKGSLRLWDGIAGELRPVLWSQAEPSYLDNQGRAKDEPKQLSMWSLSQLCLGGFTGHLRCSVAWGISPLLCAQHRSGLLKRMCQWKQLELNSCGGGGNLVRIKIRWCKRLPLFGCSEPSGRVLTCLWTHSKSFQVALFLSPFYRREDGKINWSTPNCTDGK